jgi:hypothetical protein
VRRCCADVRPTPDHSLLGVDSSVASAGKYYRNWPGNGNSNVDCAASAGFATDAKGLDLWAAQSSPAVSDMIAIVAAPTTPDVGTSAAVVASAFPGQTVFGSFVFRNDGQAAATGVSYSATIGSPRQLSGQRHVHACCPPGARGELRSGDRHRHVHRHSRPR